MVGKAPLRESIAAAMLLASGWDRRQPLLDPFCGSGTIAIEAALLAADVAPGLGRSFALQQWPDFAPGTWASVIGEAKGRAAAGLDRARTEGTPLLVATDRDAGAIEATRSNAARAGVDDLIDVRRASVSELPVLAGVEPGWVLTNPPWGGRLDAGGDLRDLYARLGQVISSGLDAGWRAGLLCGDDRLAGHTGLSWREELRLIDGGIGVEFLVTE
jgi:23S rRNA G2445 N2-methylase RlmL